jgi:hypothetical protein
MQYAHVAPKKLETKRGVGRRLPRRGYIAISVHIGNLLTFLSGFRFHRLVSNNIQQH